jgi:hypothetical protein
MKKIDARIHKKKIKIQREEMGRKERRGATSKEILNS